MPPYIAFIVLAEALWRLNLCENHKYSLSKKQIAIQFSAGFAYAISGTIAYIKSSNNNGGQAVWYIATILDWFSLFVLTITLSEIASLQLEH